MIERDIFLAVLDLPDAAARGAYLDGACGGDDALRVRVEALLRSHETAGDFLATPAVAPPAEPARRHDPLETQAEQPTAPGDQPALDFMQPSTRPGSLGRLAHYEVEAVLGQGGFGTVLQAFDDRLQRRVAIKLPHRHLVSRPQDAEPYLTEARTVAGLDHPNIVPVFDVGSSTACPCFIVSKFIEGSTLAWRIKHDRPSFEELAELAATLAEALHYAHRKGLVHRDIKPDNVLLDTSGKPFVVDFGLALREESFGQGPRYGGTLAYMSPEQARGEGHRVDGRSDIFSLGVVFYELLVGRRPFRADSQRDLPELITSFEPLPPRQVDEAVPGELERICLKALAKCASERYATAKDLADDVRHWQAGRMKEEGRRKYEHPAPG